jgi:uncharacterized protein (DUF2384 family)
MKKQSVIQSQIAVLYTKGADVFGSAEKFSLWMDSVLLPFGNKKPKEFLDTSARIDMIMDELCRIEHGVLA